MSGQIREAAMKQFTYIVQGTQNIETKIQRLTACYSNHFSSLDLRDKDLVQNYLKYLRKNLKKIKLFILKNIYILRFIFIIKKKYSSLIG